MPKLQNFTTAILTKRQSIITTAKMLAYLLAAAILAGGWLIYIHHELAIDIMLLGTNLGKVSLILYILTLIPGIFRRFQVAHPFLAVLTTFRRQLGIFTYLFAFAHYFFMRGALQIRAMELFSLQTFELFGLTALLLITPLFLTSNDFSVRTLGRWWKKVHRLTYIALGAIFLHVLLQGVSIWSVLIGTAFIAQALSGIYAYISNKNTQNNSPATTQNQVQ